MDLITGFDVDLLFKWPHGRAERLARRGELPYYSLPDGSIRFARSEVEGLVCRGGGAGGQCAGVDNQTEASEPIHEEQVPGPEEVGGVHQPGIGLPAQVQEKGGVAMNLYDVFFRDGSVGQVEASNKAVAKRRARELSDEPIDAIEEAEDDESVDYDADEAESEDGDPDSFEDDDEEDD